ncbi:hypothetical protein LTR86_004696 [Recurvomyces mirabilis]|nr:hypothetical protein LTR86_004696 [Recurvomyces mirabilis]
MTTPASRTIFVLGIKLTTLPPHLEATYGSLKQIGAKVTEDLERCHRNGFPCTLRLIDPQDVDGSVSAFASELKASGNKYEAVIFGAGIRTHTDPIPFERAIATVRRTLRPNVPVLFNDGPDRHAAAIERHFGVKFEQD